MQQNRFFSHFELQNFLEGGPPNPPLVLSPSCRRHSENTNGVQWPYHFLKADDGPVYDFQTKQCTTNLCMYKTQPTIYGYGRNVHLWHFPWPKCLRRNVAGEMSYISRTFRPRTFRSWTFRPGYFGHGRFGPDISVTDISATDNTKGGRFGHNNELWVGNCCTHVCEPELKFFFAISVYKTLAKGQKAQKFRFSLLALRGEIP